MIRRILPHPGLSVFLIILWLLLANRPSLGSLVLAVTLGVALPLLTARWWPERAAIRNWPALLAYLCLALWDIIIANIQVAKIILFMPADQIQSAWIAVPLNLTAPEAISLLSATITLTPGTITADMSADGRVLLIHALHAPDPDAVRDEIKQRYEARLQRIFA